MSCVHIGGALSPEKLELANKQKFRYTSPRRTKRKRGRLAKMASSSFWLDRMAAAGNPMTDPEVLYLLSKDQIDAVRAWVARNPCLGLGTILSELRDDPNGGISAYANFRWKQLEEENEEHQDESAGELLGQVDLESNR